jgi:hypothetical protein
MINLVITHNIWSPYPPSVIRCVPTRTMVKRPRVLLCSTTEKVEWIFQCANWYKQL